MKRTGQTTRHTGESGFTLIEILVAMLVFLTGVAGIYALLSTGLFMQKDGLEMARAGRRVELVVQIVQRELPVGRADERADELAHEVPVARLPDGTYYRVTPVGGAGAEGVRVVEIRVAGTEAGLDHAQPFTYLLGEALGDASSMAASVAAWRTQRQLRSLTRSNSRRESR